MTNYDAQYLGDPLASGGQIVNPDWFRTFATARKPDVTVLSIDPAFTKDGGNFSAALVGNIVLEDIELIHAEEAQLDYPGLLRWIERLDKKYNPDVIAVEAIGSGIGLRYHLDKYGISHVFSITSHGGLSKQQRMELVSPQIEAGRVWVPQSAAWKEPFLKRIGDFPNGASDDMPDALSQLLRHLEKIRRWGLHCRDQRFPPDPPPDPFPAAPPLDVLPVARNGAGERRSRWRRSTDKYLRPQSPWDGCGLSYQRLF